MTCMEVGNTIILALGDTMRAKVGRMARMREDKNIVEVVKLVEWAGDSFAAVPW